MGETNGKSHFCSFIRITPVHEVLFAFVDSLLGFPDESETTKNMVIDSVSAGAQIAFLENFVKADGSKAVMFNVVYDPEEKTKVTTVEATDGRGSTLGSKCIFFYRTITKALTAGNIYLWRTRLRRRGVSPTRWTQSDGVVEVDVRLRSGATLKDVKVRIMAHSLRVQIAGDPGPCIDGLPTDSFSVARRRDCCSAFAPPRSS